MNWKKYKRYYVIAVVAVVIIFGYYWRSKNSGNNQVQYVTATAEKGTLTVSVSGSGNVIVDQSVNIDPTITGTVSNLAVNVGDVVKKGQSLFSIVNDQLGVSVSQATASYSQAQSSIDSAEANLKQAKATYSADKKNDVSDKQLKADREKIDAAEQSVEAAKLSFSASGSNLQYQRQTAGKRLVTSPIEGTVNAVNIKNGDDLSKLSSGSSRQVPMIIGDLSTMKAQVQVNEVDISSVQLGQKAVLTFDAINELTLTGKVEKMDSLGTVSQGVVTYNVTIGFDNLDQRIKPGMSVSANIITAVKQDVLLAPTGAVKAQNGSNYVEVLNSGQAPQQTSVTVGASNNTETEIVSGIKVGDKVVTQTINLSSSSSATTASSSGSRSGQGSGTGFRVPGLGGFGH